MKIIITGGLGFIGSMVAEQFVARRCEVLLMDDMRANVVDSVDGATILRADMRTVPWPTDADLVVHCASPVGAVSLLSQAGRIAGEIVSTTEHAAQYCARFGAPLINISTSEVYGRSGTNSEGDELAMPPRHSARLEYAAGKVAAEQIVRNTPNLLSLNIRPFNIAGPRQASAKGFAIPTFIEQALAGRDLTVFEDGKQERAFTSVYDLGAFCVHVAGEPDRFNGQVVNFGNPDNRTTIIDLARRVIDATQSRSQIVHTTGKAVHGDLYEEAAAGTKVPDVSHLHREFGWTPRMRLDDLLDLSIADYRRAVAA